MPKTKSERNEYINYTKQCLLLIKHLKFELTKKHQMIEQNITKIFIKKKDHSRTISCLLVECSGIKLMVGVANTGHPFFIYILCIVISN